MSATAPLTPDAVAERVRRLPELREQLGSDDPEVLLRATHDIRRMLSVETNPPIQHAIDAGVVPMLVAFLSRTDISTELLYEAAWALTNIASGTSEHTRVVVECAAVPQFVALLSHANADIAEQAAWALGNIAGDSAHLRDVVIECGALPKFVQLFDSGGHRVSLMRNCTWAMSNLFRGKPGPALEKVQAGIPALALLIHNSDQEVVQDACWALSYLSDGANERIQAVIDAGCVSRVVELLMSPTPTIVTPALRCVGNVVTGSDTQTQVVLNCNVIPALSALLTHPKKTIRKETCWTLSNITAGNAGQIQTIIDGGLIPGVINLLRTDAFEVRKEALWAISNLTEGGTPEQIAIIVEQGAVPVLAEMLGSPDARLITVALDGLKNILSAERARRDASGEEGAPWCDQLEECGGLDRIEGLQTHASEEVYRRALHLLETFFNAEAEQETPGGAEPADPSLDMLANNAFSLVAPAPLDAAMGALNLGGGVPVAPAPQQSDSEDDGAAVAPEELEGDGEGRGDDDDDVGSNNDDEADDGGGAFVF